MNAIHSARTMTDVQKQKLKLGDNISVTATETHFLNVIRQVLIKVHILKQNSQTV
jgi:hypothetical protein